MAAVRAAVLFVCVYDAGRSRMAAALLTHLARDRVEVRSAGSEPAERVNPAVVEAMREAGIVEAVHPIRDEIERRVRGLIAERVPAAP